jgi:hypothetical protein
MEECSSSSRSQVILKTILLSGFAIMASLLIKIRAHCSKVIVDGVTSAAEITPRAANFYRNGPCMITIVYGSILRPSSNNWASYRRLKWQIAALFL